jgi:gliding motility-associated-like protein
MLKQFPVFCLLFLMATKAKSQIDCINCYNQTSQLSPAASNMILNPSFEIFTGSIGDYFCPAGGGTATFANWTCSGGGTSTYASIVSNSFSIIPQGVAAPYLGTFFAEACSSTVNDTSCLNKSGCEVTGIPPGFPLNTPSYGGATGVILEQTVTGLVPGNTYILEFWTGGESFGSFLDDGLFGLDIGFGVNYLVAKPTDPAPNPNTGVRYSVQFRAATPSHVIKFINWGHICSTCTELILDDVKLYPLSQLNPIYTPCFITNTVNLCAGEFYTMSNGTVVTQTGSYTDTVKNTLGADSAYIYITISPVIPITYKVATICSNQTYTLPDGALTSAPGVYIDTFQKNGCDSIITTTLNVITTVPYTISNDTIHCEPLAPVPLIASGGNTISWTSSAGALGCPNCYNQIVNPTGSTNYYAEITDGNGCKVLDTVRVVINPFVMFLNISNQNICEGQPISISSQIIGSGASGTLNYGNGTVVNQSPLLQYTYNAPGTYTVTLIGKDTLACSDTITRVMNVYGKNNLNFTLADSIICEGEPVIITDVISSNVVNFEYEFLLADKTLTNVHNPIHTYEDAGNYIIQLTGENPRCPDSVLRKNVYVKEIPIVNLGPDTSICPGLTAPINLFNINTVSPIQSYLWSNGETNSVLPIAEANTYWLQANNFNCIASDTIVVRRDCYINIPNAFTPGSSDNLNAYFFPRDILSKGVTAFSMNVFNRWGNEVFNTTNINGRGWDGLYGGKPQPMGVYIYNMSVVFKNGERKTYTGNVTLLR